jgi:transposase-like protein
MGKNIFKEPYFHDEEAARAWFEAARWPEGRACPTCGSLKSYETKKAGRYRCGEKQCRRDFTVMTGTVMERSHAKLTQWAAAFHMAASSKKGFSAHQLHRTLGCQYNTAWFLHHRVMEAMRRGGLEVPLGGSGSVVEADETYFGPTDEPRPRPKNAMRLFKGGKTGPANKRAIISLVERGGNVRSFHVYRADSDTVTKIVNENIARETKLYTDESKLYIRGGKNMAAHETVMHSIKEYVRYTKTDKIHTNTIEGYFSIFKRGMKGVYQHCGEKHLHRYLAEFDFRYNTRDLTDAERSVLAAKSGEGKRLTYHQPRQA